MEGRKAPKLQQPDGKGHGHGSDSEAGEPYKYTPLPEPEPTEPGQDPLLAPKTLWTRLVTIHPAQYDDDIAIDLTNVALEETAKSRLRDEDVYYRVYHVVATSCLKHYEALSYVWGSPENPSHVIVGEERRRIPITRNLDVAIRHLRYADHPRIIWIDALCIDQTSPSDKNRQVGYMSFIYWSTPRVVVWLGPKADDSDHAMDLLDLIGEKIRVKWALGEIRCFSREDEDIWGVMRGPKYLPLDERDWAAIESLIKRSWFERIWIRQEIMWAKDEATVYCGSSCISLELFRRGLYRVHIWKGTTETRAASIVLFPRHFVKLEDLRFSVRGAKCTDPKDYVYGTLGLLSGVRHLAIRPDYSKSLAEIFQDLVLRHIDISKSLEILDSCGNDPEDRQSLSSAENTKLPSWVPDWTSGTEMPFLLAFYARFVRIASRAELVGNGVLRAAGLTKGVIRDFIELDRTTQLDTMASLRNIVPHNAADTQYPGGGTLWDAYRISLCGNCFTNRSIPAPPFFSLSEEDSHAALEAIIHGEWPALSPGSTLIWPDDSPESRFISGVRWCWTRHRYFITDNGLMGWAPKWARQGDRIAIMLGSEIPTVLRPVSSQENDQYEVIGPCYLQGFMYGETFLGPLPEGMRPIVHHENNGFGKPYFKFLDTKSGEGSLRDPRSDAFPDSDQSWAWQRGETKLLTVAVEDLRSAGLDIRYFNLV